jgi:dephospho-CoA kinase
MLKIGLTGGIGSGKSTVAKMFAKHGVRIIDTDQISREITQPGTEGFNLIVDHFGKNILDEEGQLNRAALREIVFSNEDERLWLEQALHPPIIVAMQHALEMTEGAYCISLVPLLVEVNAIQFFDRILVVDAPEEYQLERAQKRDARSAENIKNIIKAQLPREERLKYADDVITNDGDLKKLRHQVSKLHRYYTQLSKKVINQINNAPQSRIDK